MAPARGCPLVSRRPRSSTASTCLRLSRFTSTYNHSAPPTISPTPIVKMIVRKTVGSPAPESKDRLILPFFVGMPTEKAKPANTARISATPSWINRIPGSGSRKMKSIHEVMK
jgi:hypothetical protein